MMGTPIISYDIGGCSDIIGEYGKLIKFGDLDSFIKTIESYKPNDYRRDEIMHSAKERFGVSRMTNEYLALYSEVILDE